MLEQVSGIFFLREVHAMRWMGHFNVKEVVERGQVFYSRLRAGLLNEGWQEWGIAACENNIVNIKEQEDCMLIVV